MTRATPLTRAGTAKRTAPAGARARPEPASMRFHVFEDNGGGYHWTIIAANGESLVHSARFTSYEDAKQAARIVHAGAASASFAQLAASFAHLAADTPPIVLGAPRDTPPGRDDQDAERWLDEGGSFSSEAVT